MSKEGKVEKEWPLVHLEVIRLLGECDSDGPIIMAYADLYQTAKCPPKDILKLKDAFEKAYAPISDVASTDLTEAVSEVLKALSEQLEASGGSH